MKYIWILIFIPSMNTFCQSIKIDSSNYYSYYHKTNHKTIWIREKEVFEIIDEVLEDSHIEVFSRNVILKLQGGEHMRLTMYSNKYHLGILYIQGHSMTPIKSERGMSIYDVHTDYKYLEWIELTDGTRTGYKILKIPDNIIVLTENSYWYQEPLINSNQQIVTKDIIIEIFKSDLKKALSEKINR